MLKLNNISKDYVDNENIVHALKNVSLKIKEGEMTIITGKSGSGKTTLMNIIGGIDNPTSGEVYLDDVSLSSLDNSQLSKHRNMNVGYIFQMFYLEPNFTALENVTLPLLISGVSKEKRNEIGVKKLKEVGLDEKIYVKTSKLSGGEKQRVCIARALVNDPKIILADEPTGNLDSINGDNILNILKDLSNKNKIVIVITHNLDDAIKYGDSIIKISDGMIVNESTR